MNKYNNDQKSLDTQEFSVPKVERKNYSGRGQGDQAWEETCPPCSGTRPKFLGSDSIVGNLT